MKKTDRNRANKKKPVPACLFGKPVFTASDPKREAGLKKVLKGISRKRRDFVKKHEA